MTFLTFFTLHAHTHIASLVHRCMFLHVSRLFLLVRLGCAAGMVWGWCCCGGSLLCRFLPCACLCVYGRSDWFMDATARRVRFQCPNRRRGSKDGVSRPSDDKTLCPRRIRACSRTAGVVRGPVVGSSPGRRSRARMTQGAVTPSAHLWSSGIPLRDTWSW